MIYYTSDCHFGHANICRGVTKWGEIDKNGVFHPDIIGTRDFNTVEEMNNAIIKSINSVVKEDDTLVHAGDLAFGGWENIWNFRKQLVVKRFIQINGNHDEHIKKDKFFKFLEKQEDFIYEIDNHNDFRIMGQLKHKSDVTARDLFTEVHDGRHILEIDGQTIVIDHYPEEEWYKMDKGSWHFHGHVHNQLDNCETNTRYKRFDLGWKGKVYSHDELSEIMLKREIKPHH